jgi:DNA-binding GntR family transcriptional regulator
MDSELDLLVLRGGESLADSIYESLRDAVCDGVLKPGYRLREVALAQQFNVSSTPIREAIHRLDHEGLAKLEPRRGAVVTRPQLNDIAGLLEVRELLGVAGARKAAARAAADPEGVALAEAVLAEGDASVEALDQRAFARSDVRFHVAVNRIGGNDQIRKFDEVVQRQIQQARRSLAHFSPDRMAESQQEHWSILRALKVGDPDAAEAAYRHHIRTAGDALLTLYSTLAP